MSHTDIIPYFFEMNMLILFISKAFPKIILRDKEIRTPGNRCRKSVLYPLSYTPLHSFFCGWRDLNPHAVLAAGDFKSPVSTIPPQPHDFLNWAELDLNQCRQASGFTVRPH